MANAFYEKGREAILAGDAPWDTTNIKVALVDAADYTINLSTHDFYNDVTVAGRVATSGNLASKTVVNGVADAADVTISAVTGDPSELLIVFGDSGTESTSPLLVAFDTATGLPFTPNGGDLTISWNASGIFKI
jgi:hypothetical protein